MTQNSQVSFQKGRWPEIKTSIKGHWNRLTDEDLEAIGGHLQELEGRIEKRYGWSKEKVRDSVSSFLRSVKVLY